MLNIEINLSKVNTDVAASIFQAMQNNQYFALKSKWTMQVFDVNFLRSYFINRFGIMTTFNHGNMGAFENAIKMCLLGHGEFVPGHKALDYFVAKAIGGDVKKLLGE